jgi:hypothetical protein
MAKESAGDEQAGKLRDEIARSRQRVTEDLRRVRADLDFPRKLRKSFRTQPVLWIGGAVVIGAVLTALSRGGKKIYFPVKASAKAQNKFVAMGVALGALRLATNLLKPVIVSFIAKKMGVRGNGRPRGK